MSEQLQIAFISHPYHRGGVTRWMANAASAFARMGHAVSFLTFDPAYLFAGNAGKEKMVDVLHNEPGNIKIISPKVGYEFELGTQDYVTSRYRKVILEHLKPGTFLILSDHNLIWKAASTLGSQYPVIGVLHCDLNYYYELARKYHPYLKLVVGVSERISKRCREENPLFDPQSIVTAYCGTELPPFEIIDRQNPETLKLIFVGRFEATQKRVGDLWLICKSLLDRRVLFRLDIVGNDSSKDAQYISVIENAGLSNVVHLHGWKTKPEITAMMMNADILVLTSDYEGTPIVMMEALACGCGFVGTSVSGVEDFEADRLSENCVEVYPIGAIDEAVNKITKLGAVRAAVRATAARKMAETYFDLEKCLTIYLDHLRSIDLTKPAKSLSFQFSLKGLIYSRLLATALKLGLIKRRDIK